MIDVIGERSDILVSADNVSISDDQYQGGNVHISLSISQKANVLSPTSA